MLRAQTRSKLSPVFPRPPRQNSPLAATLLSLIVPGLGAAYNGQTSKALVHFAIFASFFQMATVTDGMPFFILGVIGTWLFSAVDACRTAQLMRAGLAADAEGDVIARRLYGNPYAWGATLVAIGTIFLLHTLLGVQLPVRQFLPVTLVALGAYMLVDYFRLRRKRDAELLSFDMSRRPPSVVSGSLNDTAFRSGEVVTQVAARGVRAFPFETQR